MPDVLWARKHSPKQIRSPPHPYVDARLRCLREPQVRELSLSAAEAAEAAEAAVIELVTSKGLYGDIGRIRVMCPKYTNVLIAQWSIADGVLGPPSFEADPPGAHEHPHNGPIIEHDSSAERLSHTGQARLCRTSRHGRGRG